MLPFGTPVAEPRTRARFTSRSRQRSPILPLTRWRWAYAEGEAAGGARPRWPRAERDAARQRALRLAFRRLV